MSQDQPLIKAEKTCCTGNCNQGRDCPLRRAITQQAAPSHNILLAKHLAAMNALSDFVSKPCRKTEQAMRQAEVEFRADLLEAFMHREQPASSNPGPLQLEDTHGAIAGGEPEPNGQIRLEDIAAMRDELAKIAVAVGRSKTDGNDCDWFELAGDVAALAAGVPKGWSLCRLNNSEEILVISAPDGLSVTLSPQGTGLASQLLYQLTTTLMGGQTS